LLCVPRKRTPDLSNRPPVEPRLGKQRTNAQAKNESKYGVDYGSEAKVHRGTQKRTNRRNFLKYAGAAAAGLAAGAVAGRLAWVPPPPSTTATETETPTATQTKTVTETLVYPASLRVAAEARDLLVGAAALPEGLREEQYASTLASQFNFLTATDPTNWQPTDTLVRFASDHQMKVKGPPLIGARSPPAWASSERTERDLRWAMEQQIRRQVTHYRGKFYAWDVVNEAVDINGLRKSVFLEKLGEGYIAEAFQLAHNADPKALLFYNDYDAEGAGGLQKTKSDQVYELVKRLAGDGVPIHGVGLQMHLFAVEYPNPEDIAANVRRLAALGLKVNISEMDVRIKELPLPMSQRLEIQRRIYHDVIAACIEEKGFIGVTFFGFTDAHSWINEPGGGEPDYPLLFDENYQPKPAYWGVMDALLGR